MKKIIQSLTIMLLTIVFLSVTVFAKDYTSFNLVFEEKEGEKVNDTSITIYAAVDDGSLEDRTTEFTLESVEWFKYLTEPEDGKTADDYDYVDEELHIFGMLATDEDVFEPDNFSYFLRIGRLFAQEEDSFSRDVKINGIDIDELNGLCFNAGNEFFIKTVTNGHLGTPTVSEPEDIENDEPTEEVVEPDIMTPEVHKCKVCGICPIQPLGICLFIWIAIAVIILILVVILIAKSKKDKKEKKEE